MTSSEHRQPRNRFWLWIGVSFFLGMLSIVGGIALIYFGATVLDTSGQLPSRAVLSEGEMKARRQATLDIALKAKRKATRSRLPEQQE